MLTKIKLKFHHIVFDFFSFIKKGNERSIKAKKNILAMLFLKGREYISKSDVNSYNYKLCECG